MSTPYYARGINNPNGTCLNKEGLLHYIKLYNLFHSDSPIIVDLTETDKDGSLIRAIHKKLFIQTPIFASEFL